jgi:hypothetical protein
MAETMALSESEALDLLAFVMTAARISHEEPSDYSRMRLLQTAERLCIAVGPRSRDTVRELMSHLAAEIPDNAAHRHRHPEQFLIFLDESCRLIARALMAHRGVERAET